MKKIYPNWQYSKHLKNYTAYEEALLQLCYGVRWDGDLINKAQIGKLVANGHAVRWNGWNMITDDGVKHLHEAGAIKA